MRSLKHVSALILTISTLIYLGLLQNASKTTVIKYMYKETIINDGMVIKNTSNTIQTNKNNNNTMNFTSKLKIMDNLQKKTLTTSEVNFSYPLNIDMVKLVKDLKEKKSVFYKPINVYKYKLVKNCESQCNLQSDGKSKLLLFAIKSAVANFKRRKIIRETWGQEITLDGFVIKRVFNLGLPNDGLAEKTINIEYEEFGDLIQYNFNDRYYNNTLKTIGTINWITSFCKQVSFVLFVDDDYFVSPHNLVAALKLLKDSQEKTLYMGHVSYNLAPVRHPDRKWYVPHSEYPFTKYPSFINAGSYVMSIQTVIDIQIAIPYTQFFRLDDVYLGIVADKLHINLLHNKNFRRLQIPITKKAIADVIASHDFTNSALLIKAWEIHTQIRKSSLK